MGRVYRTLSKLLFVSSVAIMAAWGQVVLPVIVSDRSGQVVHGLQNSDFSVHCEKGFSLVSAQEIAPATVSKFKDPVPIYVLYDVLTIPAPKQGTVSKVLLSYLRAAALENRAVTLLVLTDGGLQVIHEMTTDPAVLRAALDLLDSKQLPGAVGQGEQVKVKEETERLRRLTQLLAAAHFKAYTPAALQQLQAMARIGEMLHGSPKRKLLVWLTGPFPVTVDSGELHFNGLLHTDWDPSLAGLADQYQRAIDSLNASHVSVYAIRIFRASHELRDPTDYGLSDFAQATGGRSLGELDPPEFSTALADLTREPQSYYSLTLNGSLQKSSWVGCKVNTNVPDTRVSAPKGFFVNP
jgi:VWFA-related protein